MHLPARLLPAAILAVKAEGPRWSRASSEAPATQTAKATDKIRGQITAIQPVTDEAVAAVQEIARTIIGLNEIATAVASAVEQQSSATREIACSVQETAQGTDQVSSNIGGVQ